MIWTSLGTKCFFLTCAVVFVISLGPQGHSEQEQDQRVNTAALQSNVHSERHHSFITTVGLNLSDTLPRSVPPRNKSKHTRDVSAVFEAPVADLIHVNEAGAEALPQLPGIGVVLAQRIVDFRDLHGPFNDMTTLTGLKGIGPKRLANIQPYLHLAIQ